MHAFFFFFRFFIASYYIIDSINCPFLGLFGFFSADTNYIIFYIVVLPATLYCFKAHKKHARKLTKYEKLYIDFWNLIC